MPRTVLPATRSLLAAATVVFLAGCSAIGQPEQTAAIAPPPAAAPGGTAPAATGTPVAAADGTVVPGAKGAPVATTAAQAVPVAMAECDALKVELAAFKTDKIPEKLAQFGQSKYTPTPDESTRFARYVAVNQASKQKCTTTASAAPVMKKKVAKAVTAELAPAADAPVVKKVAVKKKVAPVTEQAAVPDPLTNPTMAAPADAAPLEGIMTTGTSG
jgi:hypothetical protein